MIWILKFAAQIPPLSKLGPRRTAKGIHAHCGTFVADPDSATAHCRKLMCQQGLDGQLSLWLLRSRVLWHLQKPRVSSIWQC
eukprot:symbB.v1.2.024983.t1/scaffold2400.1/size80086/8